MYQKRQAYHVSIRRDQKRIPRGIKINALYNAAYLPLIESLPASLDEITKMLDDNNGEMVRVLRENLDAIRIRVPCKDYYQWNAVNYIYHSISIQYQQADVARIVLNETTTKALQLPPSYQISLLSSHILKLVFLNLKYVNQMTDDNSNLVYELIKAQITSYMSGDESRYDGFKMALDILHMGLSLITTKEQLQEQQTVAIVRLVEKILIEDDEIRLSEIYLKEDNLLLEQTLDVLINLTFLYREEKLYPIVSRYSIEIMSQHCLLREGAPLSIQRKAVQLMTNCVLVAPLLRQKLKQAGIVRILLEYMNLLPTLFSNIVQFLEAYLITAQDSSLVKHFIEILGTPQLLMKLGQKYESMDSDTLALLLKVVYFLIYQDDMPKYYTSQYLELLKEVYESTPNEQIQDICQQQMDILISTYQNIVQMHSE